MKPKKVNDVLCMLKFAFPVTVIRKQLHLEKSFTSTNDTGFQTNIDLKFQLVI